MANFKVPFFVRMAKFKMAACHFLPFFLKVYINKKFKKKSFKNSLSELFF